MVTRKVVSLWVAGISIVNFVVGYALGAVYQNYAIFSPIFCFIPSLVTFITLTILDKRREKITSERWTFGKPLTRRTDDGSYMLDPENLFEAVEKLGYYEYEWKGGDSNVI